MDDTRQDAIEILNSICGSMNAIEKLGNGSGTAWEAVDSVSGSRSVYDISFLCLLKRLKRGQKSCYQIMQR